MNGFPNKAGTHADTDAILRAELKAAGIPTIYEHDGLDESRYAQVFRDMSGEVKTSVIGLLHGWKFTRAWYYWVGEGPGIEFAAAQKLYESHGKTARVLGHAGGISPLAAYKGLACGLYHVDDADGLKALADTIRDLVAEHGGA